MCKIIAIINKNKKNKVTINKLLKSNIDLLKAEPNGYSIFRDDKTKFYLNDYDNIYNNIEYKNEDMYITHFRTSTSGSNTISGLHLHTINDFVYAHNGIVQNYTNITKKNDSYYFVKNYLKKVKYITSHSLSLEATSKGFWGKLFLYNPITKQLVIIMNSQLQVTILKDCLIFSTFDLKIKTKHTTYKTMLGFKYGFNTTTKNITNIKKQLHIDDTYLEFEKGELISQTKIKINRYQNQLAMPNYNNQVINNGYNYQQNRQYNPINS